MAEFINSLTGTRMWVEPEREEEYRLAGHKSVDEVHARAENAPAFAPKPRSVPGKPKTTRKK